jgi:hypothetical protein
MLEGESELVILKKTKRKQKLKEGGDGVVVISFEGVLATWFSAVGKSNHSTLLVRKGIKLALQRVYE